MAASGSDAVSRVHNFKIIGNFVQTFMSAKGVCCYIGGWQYILADFSTDHTK